MELPVGLLQVGNLAHAGTAPRSPEVEQDVFRRRVLYDGFERHLLAVGVGLYDVDIGLSHVGLELLLGILPDFGHFPGLLQLRREEGDLVQNLLARKSVGLLREHHHAEIVVAVLLEGLAAQLLVLLLDGLAALVGGLRIAEFADQLAAGGHVGRVGVVRYGACREQGVLLLLAAGHRDRARFEDQHDAERSAHVAGVGQDGARGGFGHAFDAECAVLYLGRVEQLLLPVEQIDRLVDAFEIALDDMPQLHSTAAAAASVRIFFMVVSYFLSSVISFSRARTRLSSSGSRLKTLAARWYCMPGSAG